MIGRMLLPVYGNSASVWATCLVYFQGLLLAGYAYAARVSAAPRRLQVWGHLVLVALPLLVPPFHVLTFQTYPVLSITLSLTVAVGLPFFVLSGAGVMVQAWFGRSGHPRRDDPFFLYASSNAGALAALFAYPFLVEPTLGLAAQRRAWWVGYAVHVALMVLSAWITVRSSVATPAEASHALPNIRRRRPTTELPADTDEEPSRKPAGWYQWFLLAAGANALLMATNNVVTLDAPVPLLWVVPLGTYLTTLIVSFGPRAPSQRLQGVLSGVGLVVIVASLVALVARVHQQVAFLALNSAILWNGALLCHARLARSRPSQVGRLGRYYLALSAGGWFGALLVGVILPVLQRHIAISFLDYVEAKAIKATFRRKPWLAVSLGLLLALAGLTGLAAARRYLQAQVDSARTFYGIYRVSDKGGLRWFQHGNTIHGVQPLSDKEGKQASGYYHPRSPVAHIFQSPMVYRRVGIVGLGAGTLAAYERPGQRWTFFELDPEVERIARADFTYLQGAEAPTRVVIGDARLTLQREPDGGFDLLVLDTFSSDFLPIHLITQEAVELYFRKLTPNGLLVFHISSRLFDVAPVLARLAGRVHAYWALSGKREDIAVDTPDGYLPSRWFAMTRDADKHGYLVHELHWIEETGRGEEVPSVWTDDHVNLFDAL